MEKIDKIMMQIFDLIEIVDQNMCIIVTDHILDDPGPHILYVNKKWQDVTGYSSEEVLGKTPRILQGELSDKKQLAKLKETLKNDEKFGGSTINYHKDGTPFNMVWIVIAPINKKYYVALQKVALQKVVLKNDDLEQLKSIKDIQLHILKKLNEVLPLTLQSKKNVV